MSAEAVARIRALLESGLQVDSLEIHDDSALHVGHAGARDGGGHYRITIVSPDFANRGTIARHRLIYQALDEMMKKDIHALAIKALSADEAI